MGVGGDIVGALGESMGGKEVAIGVGGDGVGALGVETDGRFEEGCWEGVGDL